MNKNLLAFFLASLTLSLPLMILSTLSKLGAKPTVNVVIRSSSDVADIVNAIESLHRIDVTIHTEKTVVQGGIIAILGAAVMAALGFMFLSACVAGLYKFYCRKLGVSPSL